jgi:hypothetical protein
MDADATLIAWLKAGRYLPKFMRDFHDQKDLFKAMHETVDIKGHDIAGKVDAVTGHCYVIDVFLWFMARRGYTLQRSPAKFEFMDLRQTVRDCKERRAALFGEVLR